MESSASAIRRKVARIAFLYSFSFAVSGMVRFPFFDTVHQVVDALERGGGAVRLPLDTREDRDLDLRVELTH